MEVNLTVENCEIENILKLLDEAEKNTYSHNFDSAKELIDEALNLSDKHCFQKGKANALRLLGTISCLKAENNQAKHILLQAHEAFKEVTDDFYGKVKVNSNLGVIYGNLGLYKESLMHFHQAISFAEQKNDLVLCANQYVNMASIYRKMSNFKEAFKYYDYALQIREKINDKSGLAVVYNNIGNIYEALKDYGIALGYFKKAYKTWLVIDFKRGTTIALHNIAKVYHDLKEYDKSLEYFEQVLLLAFELKIYNIQAMCYCSMASIMLEKKQLLQVKDFLSDAEKLNEISKDSDVRILIIKTYIQYFIGINDYKSAYEYQKRLSEIKEEIRDGDIANRIASLEYDFNLKQKEAELYKLKNIELYNAKIEIEQKSEELKHMNETLKQLDSSKDAILGIVSHDLKNLIGSIYSIIDLLRFESLPPKAENYINMIDTSTQRALKLVKDILESNTIEMNDFTLNLEIFKLNEVLAGFLNTSKINAENKRINLKLSFCEEDCLVKIQLDRFWQIIDNLINNAIKFSNEGSNIYITTDICTENNVNYALVIIRDEGIGITKENQRIIFNKFTKAKRKGTKGEMTVGLGLSIVKKLVELHNADIFVNSELGKGTEFILKFKMYN